MKIYVNPYASVVTISNNKYFYDSDSDKLYDIDILAAKYSLENQYSSPIYLKLVEKIIGSELTTLLLDKGFFLLEKPDITTQKSRTSGYLYYYSEDIASKYKNEIEKKKY